jgi:electron transport complex protein RnfA
MPDYAHLFIGAALVNNLLLIQLLGLCPALENARQPQRSWLVALGTSIVILLAAMLGFLGEHLLQGLHLTYLRTQLFIVVIATLLPLVRMTFATGPARFMISRDHGLLIVLNSAVLGVPLLNDQASRDFIASMVYALGGAVGISLVLILFANIRKRIAVADSPAAFRGMALDLVTFGLMSLAIMGFAGLARG